MESVSEELDIKDRFMGLKRMRQPFTPQFCERCNREGARVRPDQHAEAAADYLEQVQWGTPAGPQTTNIKEDHVIEEDNYFQLGPITEEEWAIQVKRMKNGKTP